MHCICTPTCTEGFGKKDSKKDSCVSHFCQKNVFYKTFVPNPSFFYLLTSIHKYYSLLFLNITTTTNYLLFSPFLPPAGRPDSIFFFCSMRIAGFCGRRGSTQKKAHTTMMGVYFFGIFPSSIMYRYILFCIYNHRRFAHVFFFKVAHYPRSKQT